MIKTAILGFGYSAQTFHLPFIQSHPDFQLSAICSRRKPELLGELASCSYYSDLDGLLADENIDLVIITTPNELHFSNAKKCLEQGKHVVLEKPFVTKVEDGEALIKLADEKKLCLTVYQNRRWDGDFFTVKQLLDDKTLGQIKVFTSHFDRFRPQVRQRWREQAGDGTGIWYDLGPHVIDQCLQLFGKPEAVTGRCRQMRAEATCTDFFHVFLHYSDKEIILNSSPYCANETLRFDIQGDCGSYRKYGLDTQESALKSGLKPTDKEWLKAIEELPGELALESSRQSYATQQGNYLAFYDGLARSIRDNAPVPVDPRDALDVIKIIVAVIKSSEQGKTLVV